MVDKAKVRDYKDLFSKNFLKYCPLGVWEDDLQYNDQEKESIRRERGRGHMRRLMIIMIDNG